VHLQCIVSFIGATLERPRIIVTEFMTRGSLLGILRDTNIDLPEPLRLRMALDMALGPSSADARRGGVRGREGGEVGGEEEEERGSGPC